MSGKHLGVNGEEDFRNVIQSLIHFGKACFQVVKVNQLGAINNNIIPFNVHREKGNMIAQGCLPLVMMGRETFRKRFMNSLNL